MAVRPVNKQHLQRPRYAAPKMTSLSEKEVEAALGPVLLSGSQSLGTNAGFSSDRARERDLGTTIQAQWGSGSAQLLGYWDE